MDLKDLQAIQFGEYIILPYVTDYSLRKIYESGQLFSWEPWKLATKLIGYKVFTREHATVVAQLNNHISSLEFLCSLPGCSIPMTDKMKIAKLLKPGAIAVAADRKTFYDVWCKYFRFDAIVPKIAMNRAMLLKSCIGDNQFLKDAYEFGKGIQILRQDPLETTISFMLSTRNSIPNIKGILRNLREMYGQDLCVPYTNISFKGMPSEKTLGNLKVVDWEYLGAGYRAEYLARLSEGIKTLEITDKLEGINQLLGLYESSDVIADLQEIHGVGPKVARCIALFAYDCGDLLPRDVWINKVIDKYFDGDESGLLKFKEYTGLIQQYMYYYSRSNPVV